MERKFLLNTTFDHFADKMDHHTQMVHSRHFPTEKGHISLQPARIGRRPLTIEMEGFYHSVKEDTETIYPITAVISFKVIPLSNERIDVTARCGQPAVESYFNKLMKEIERCYPEVREQREAEIARVRASVDRLLEEIDREAQVPLVDRAGREEGPSESELASQQHATHMRDVTGPVHTGSGDIVYPPSPPPSPPC